MGSLSNLNTSCSAWQFRQFARHDDEQHPWFTVAADVRAMIAGTMKTLGFVLGGVVATCRRLPKKVFDEEALPEHAVK